MDFVVEQTGYPPEIVELDADLEADLGIDSIKKAQLLGELREMFSLQLDSGKALGNERRSAAAELGSLRQILNFLVASQSHHADGFPAAEPKTSVKSLLKTATPAPEKRAEVESANSILDHAAEAGFLPKSESRATGNVNDVVLQRADADSRPSAVWPASEEGRRQLPTNKLPSSELPTGSLPLWRMESGGGQIANGQSRVDHRFVWAAKHNITAMSAARNHANGPHNLAACNGLATWYDRPRKELAIACEISPDSIRAFDRVVQSQVQWKPISTEGFPTPVTGTIPNHQAGQESIAWLLELEVPDWLASSSGDLLGVRQSTQSQVVSEALVVPGAVVPMVYAQRNGLMLAAGLAGEGQGDTSARFKLAHFLESLADNNLAEVANATRGIRLSVDWWLLAVDAKTANRLLVSSTGGVLVIEKSRLEPAVGSDAVTAASAPARLGLSLTQGCFVVDVQSRPSPFARTRLAWPCDAVVGPDLPPLSEDSSSRRSVEGGIAARYVLRMSPSPARSAPGRQPTWCGAAVVVGDNPVARQLCARLQEAGIEVFPLAAHEDPYHLSCEFERLAGERVMPHLFLVTPWDADAATTLNSKAWVSRREKGVLGNFWLCQKWLAHVLDAGLADQASLVAVTSLGGDFGISGEIYSAEGGGLAGLLKSMMIESWTHGVRPLPIKILDCAPAQSPAEIVDNLWQEMAVPSYDFEVSYRNGLRHVVRAIPRDVPGQTKRITRGGTWICTGGARGITAFVAEQLASRYDLKLHLVGTAPVPSIEPEWRDLEGVELRALKAEVMTTARGAGKNPVKTWQDTEKALEIDLTLRKLRQAGIEAHYHSCDISDRASLASVMRSVHRLSGPVHGVLHGAGFGKDSRFDRKQPGKVQQCIAAKVDGALALMDATRDEPLEFFIGFGSISGRFGANGHTDYSLANEMLCKLIAWYSKQRPEVKAIGFHWHAWGDVGMATKPETRLALEMIDMQFMPASEGLSHLIAELESDAAEREVLITDDRYYRMFFPAETLVAAAGLTQDGSGLPTPLIEGEVPPLCGGERAFSIKVNPARDPFLTQHLLDAKPLLPFVVASEMLLEAATRAMGTTQIQLRDVEAIGALRFFAEREAELRIETNRRSNGDHECRLTSDFTARDGRLVEANRLNFRAIATAAKAAPGQIQVELAEAARWQRAVYPGVDSKFYVGWPLQRLRKVAIVERGLVGEICAPALIELAGSDRRVQGWRIPCAAMDACLFATGILAWQQVAPGMALPVRIGTLSIGRLPDPGEACQVHVRLNSSSRLPTNRASFDLTLYGVDGELILDARDYEVAWTLGAVHHESGVAPPKVQDAGH